MKDGKKAGGGACFSPRGECGECSDLPLIKVLSVCV